MNEWIMEGMWDIRMVLESQGDVHAKVKCEDSIQFRIAESDFKSISGSRTTLPSN
jgi:hypothetical protein